MNLAIAICITAVGVLVIWLAFRRANLPRTTSIEGIEDPQVSLAYDRVSRWPQFRLLRRMITGKLAGYRPDGTMADIGCGPGYLVMLVAKKFPHLKVIGIDASEEMVSAAEANAARSGVTERVTFRRGAAGDLPFQDETLDFVISTLSLHHWSEPGAGLAEIHRVLKPNGQLLLFDFRRDARGIFLLLLRFAQTFAAPAALRRANEPLGSLLSSYSLAELGSLMAKSPFNEYSIDGGAVWFFLWGRKDRCK